MAEENTEAQENQEFAIERIYLKDLSLEIPGSPKIFLNMQHPQIELQFSINPQPVDEDYYETAFTLSVTARSENGDPIFLIESKNAAIARIKGYQKEVIDLILNITLPTTLYPFAYETVLNNLARASLPPIPLPPAVNFEQLYQQRLQQEQANQAPANDAN